MRDEKTYSIKEVSGLSGLPASTLRYYESIGIIRPVHRDASSRQRVYRQDDVDRIDSLSCLSAIGLSLEDMRTYLKNSARGKAGAKDQMELLEAQALRLETEIGYLRLRKEYVALKVRYWQAVERGDTTEAEHIGSEARALSRALKYPKE
jgi:DNA-binding transcriptional MerR regulator